MAKQNKSSKPNKYEVEIPQDLQLPPSMPKPSESADSRGLAATAARKPDTKAMEEKRAEINKKLRELLDNIKSKAKGFEKEALAKYSKNIVGILLMPPKPAGTCPKCESQNVKTSDNLKMGYCNACKHEWKLLDVLVLMKLDEEDIKKREEIEKKLREIGSKKLPDLNISVAVLDDIWDMCTKGKYDILNLIAMGMPIYDSNWISTLRAVEIHKQMVLKKFEKYVVTYIVAGSMIRGEAKAGSDVDVYIVIDDTDVTRMSVNELVSKLRAIISGMAWNAKDAANSKVIVHPQVWILTDMWNSLKNANPVIYTVIRDGVPFYDRGMFAPWKLLLKKGKITPTPEAIETHMKAGQDMLKSIKFKFKDMALDDFFWATFTPTQGALMMIGLAPPHPKQTIELVREHFVKKGLMEEKYAKMLEDILKLRKSIEHGELKEVSGKQIAEALEKSEQYLDRLDKLLKNLEVSQTKKEIAQLYNKAIEDSLAALTMVGIKASEGNAINLVQKELVAKKLSPSRYFDVLKRIKEMKDSGKGNLRDIASLTFEQDKLAEDTYDLIKATKGDKMDKYKISANYADKPSESKDSRGLAASAARKADIWLLSDVAYIVMDTTKADTEIKKFKIEENGSLKAVATVSLKELNDVLKKFAGKSTKITKHTIESLKNILADDVQLVVGA